MYCELKHALDRLGDVYRDVEARFLELSSHGSQKGAQGLAEMQTDAPPRGTARPDGSGLAAELSQCMDQMAAELQRDADATEDAVLSQCMRQMAAELQRDDAGATEDSGMSPDLYTAVSPEEVDQTDRQEPLVSTDDPNLPDPAIVAPGDVGSSDGDDDGSIQSPVFSDYSDFSSDGDDVGSIQSPVFSDDSDLTDPADVALAFVSSRVDGPPVGSDVKGVPAEKGSVAAAAVTSRVDGPPVGSGVGHVDKVASVTSDVALASVTINQDAEPQRSQSLIANIEPYYGGEYDGDLGKIGLPDECYDLHKGLSPVRCPGFRAKVGPDLDVQCMSRYPLHIKSSRWGPARTTPAWTWAEVCDGEVITTASGRSFLVNYNPGYDGDSLSPAFSDDVADLRDVADLETLF
jgi:hypothetical protein